MHELVYTSSTKGLAHGSKGFCSVAETPQIPRQIQQTLERLSGYRHIVPASADSARQNPQSHSFLRFESSQSEYLIVSRVVDAGLDYSGRSNKLAHHAVFLESEFPQGGAIPLHQSPDFFVRQWSGPPRMLDPRVAAGRSVPPAKCSQWEKIAGDAGWAGELVQAFMDKKTVNVIFELGTDVLPLIAEAQALLTDDQKRFATYSSFFIGHPPQVSCQWKFVLSGSIEASNIHRSRNSLVIDLSNPGQLSSGVWLNAARTGIVPTPAAKPIQRDSIVTSPAQSEASDELQLERSSRPAFRGRPAAPPRGSESWESKPELESTGRRLPRPKLRKGLSKKQTWIAIILAVLILGPALVYGISFMLDGSATNLANFNKEESSEVKRKRPAEKTSAKEEKGKKSSEDTDKTPASDAESQTSDARPETETEPPADSTDKEPEEKAPDHQPSAGEEETKKNSNSSPQSLATGPEKIPIPKPTKESSAKTYNKGKRKSKRKPKSKKTEIVFSLEDGLKLPSESSEAQKLIEFNQLSDEEFNSLELSLKTMVSGDKNVRVDRDPKTHAWTVSIEVSNGFRREATKSILGTIVRKNETLSFQWENDVEGLSSVDQAILRFSKLTIEGDGFDTENIDFWKFESLYFLTLDLTEGQFFPFEGAIQEFAASFPKDQKQLVFNNGTFRTKALSYDDQLQTSLDALKGRGYDRFADAIYPKITIELTIQFGQQGDRGDVLGVYVKTDIREKTAELSEERKKTLASLNRKKNQIQRDPQMSQPNKNKKIEDIQKHIHQIENSPKGQLHLLEIFQKYQFQENLKVFLRSSSGSKTHAFDLQFQYKTNEKESKKSGNSGKESYENENPQGSLEAK